MRLPGNWHGGSNPFISAIKKHLSSASFILPIIRGRDSNTMWGEMVFIGTSCGCSDHRASDVSGAYEVF